MHRLHKQTQLRPTKRCTNYYTKLRHPPAESNYGIMVYQTIHQAVVNRKFHPMPHLILPFRSSNTRSSEQVSAATLPNTHPCVTPHSHAQIQCVHFKPNLLTQKMRNSHVAPTIMIK